MADIKVELLDHMGSDLTVVNAARVSFDKASEWTTDYVSIGGHSEIIETLKPADERLISYLATHNHWSPFAHPQASFRVSAPIFVARQLQKHQVGLAWNEVSRRYVDSEPTFYTPDRQPAVGMRWRKRADNVKQGSSDETVAIPEDRLFQHHKDALQFYQGLLSSDVCPEQARMVLPQNMMTTWVWTGSLYAFSRVCNLRLDSHTQAETRVVAQYIATAMEPLFPVSWKALKCSSS